MGIRQNICVNWTVYKILEADELGIGVFSVGNDRLCVEFALSLSTSKLYVGTFNINLKIPLYSPIFFISKLPSNFTCRIFRFDVIVHVGTCRNITMHIMFCATVFLSAA